MKLSKFSKQIFSMVLALTMVVGVVFSVDFLPELKADAATTTDAVTDLYHDSASYFISNIQPKVGETVTIRMRAVKGNLSSARLYYYNLDTNSSSYVTMSKSSTQYDRSGYYEYWEATLTIPNASGIRYWFRATNKSGSYNQNKNYFLVQYADAVYNRIRSSAEYDMGWLISTKVQTPDWAKGSTWYSFVPDEFFNGDPSNDDYESDGNLDISWNNKIDENLNNRYGGDFQGVMDKIAYIKSLGVNGICFNPVNSANQSVGYGSSNFNQIESTFGNAQTYKNFINFMHDNGLRIMQDIAVYHTANDSIIVNSSNRWPTLGSGLSNGNATNVDSPYYSVIVDHVLSNNGISTPRWGGSIINHKDPMTQALLWSTEEGALVRYSNDALGYGVDGFRFDCGGWINGHDENGKVIGTTAIMQEIRAAIKAVNPESVVLSESSGSGQLNAGAYDAEWNLNFLNYTTDIYKGKSTLRSLRSLMTSKYLAFARQTLLCSHLQLNTHDNQGKHFNENNKNTLTALKLIQMTNVGAPSVYFGEETNYTDGTNYGFTYFNWDERTWNYDVMNFTKALLELRNEYSAVRTGAILEYMSEGEYWYYGRFDENGAVLTVANNTSTATTTTISAYKMGVATGETLTDWFTGKTYTVDSSGNVTVDVPAGGTIYVTGNKRSSYTSGFEATDITNDTTDNGKNVGFTVGGSDVTATYKANGTVSVAGNSSAVVKDAIIGKNFTMSGDITFTAAENSTAQANQLGISIGETVIEGKTYKVGAVLRPYISSGAQYILCLTASYNDSDSKWIGVTSGPTINKGASNTVNLKLELNNNVLKAYINGTYKAEMDISAYNIEIKPEFFSRCISDAIAFELSNVSLTGDVSTRNTAVSSTNGTVTDTRYNGVITSTADSLMFFNKPAFGAYSYGAYVDSTNGSAAVMIRDTLASDSAYYAAVLNKETLTVYLRSKAGAVPTVVTTKTASNATYIKVERDENNIFRTYLGSGTDASVNYVAVDGSAVSLGLNDSSYVGYSVLNGTASVRSIGKITAGNNVYSDDFSGTVVKPLLEGTLDSSATLGGGKLTLKPGHIFTARTPSDDWTFKTKFGFTSTTENDFAGLVNYQDADTYLFVGRKVIDGKTKLVFGKNSGGNIINFAIVDDPNPTADITIQLQRISTMYTVVYTYDETKWYSLGGKVFFNMSDENPGIMVTGATDCAFDFVSFGNAVNDGGTYNTPHTPDLNSFEVTQDKFSGTYDLKPLAGTWTNFYNGAPVPEGFLQTDAGTNAILAVTTAKYEDFRVDVTLKLEGASWAGVNFGRKNPEQIGGGYFVKYTNDGKVVLEKDGTIIKSYTLTDEVVDNGHLRVLVESIDGNVYVSVGQNAKPVIELLDFEYVSGYIALCTDGVARFNNQNILHMSAQMYKPDTAVQYSDAGVQISKGTTYYKVTVTEAGISTSYTETQYVKKFGDTNEDGTISDVEKEAAKADFNSKLREANEEFASKRIFASIRGVASTDFVISTHLSFVRKYTSTQVDTDENGNAVNKDLPNYYADMVQQAGLLLGTAAGKTELNSDGIYVKYTSEGKLYLQRNGENLATPYTVEGSPLSIDLMVVKKSGTYYVYVEGGKTPVFTYTEAISNGGAFTFLANNVVAVFDCIQIHDLDPVEDYKETSAYVDWMTDANHANKGGYFFDDFSDTSLYDDDWLVHHGDVWEVKDGALATTEEVVNSKWETGVAYNKGVYSDFILNWKMKYVSGEENWTNGWVSVGFRRVSPTSYHNANGTYLLLYPNGGISRLTVNLTDEDRAYNTENEKSYLKVNTKDQWQNFTLVVQGSSVRLYNEGKLVYHGYDNLYREGYIVFKSCADMVEYDDIEIIPLSTKSAPVVDDTDIADDLEVVANYTDYTSKYQQNKTITVGSYQPITFPNFAAPNDKYNLSATLSKVTSTAGYLETKVGIVKYNNEQYDLVIRMDPFKSSAGLNPEATLCLKSSNTTVTLDSWYIPELTTNKTSYDLDFAYENGKLSVWIDNSTAFVEDIDLDKLGVEMILPELSFYSTGCGVKVSNLAVFGGASTVATEPTTLTDGITFKGDTNNNYTYDYMLDGVLTLNSQKAYFDNANVIYLSGISAHFEVDSSNYNKDNYNFGFILGTGKVSGTTNPIYAVVSQRNKTVELYHGSNKIYSTSIKVEPEFGDNIFWDDDDIPVEENQAFTNRKEFDLSVELTNTNDLTFYMDGEELYSVNLGTLGVSTFKSKPGFVSDGVEVNVSDVSLSGIGAYKAYDIQNVTNSIVLENNNYAYVQNGRYNVTDNNVNTFNNIIFGEDECYYAAATFSSVPSNANIGFTLGKYYNDTVKLYVSTENGDIYLYEGDTLVASAGTAVTDNYKIVVGYTGNGSYSVRINGRAYDFTASELSSKEFAILTESANGTVVSDVAAWGTLSANVLIDDTYNGKVNILSMNKDSGETVLTVKPDSGHQIVAGSLKFTDANGVTRNIIGRYDDNNANEFVLYDVGTNVTVTASFVDMAHTSITTATIGSSLHTFRDTVSDVERIDGVRFLTRLYMPINGTNPQTGEITVNYNGETYTVVDYGALMIPTNYMENHGIAYSDLSFENKELLTAESLSAKQGAIYYSSEDYLDFTIVITIPKTNKTGTDRDAHYNRYYARKYVIRSYVELCPVGADASETIVIYGDSFIDSINNVVERIESEG
ncbi:MAG: alpha amylase N-terminal ig-like domain-containing protein [Clostridia bacterium]|nr:alpha amylase N-terminal ig-like domain-containing protein [Clostridia bacterium]